MLKKIDTMPPEFSGWSNEIDWYECKDDFTEEDIAVVGLDWNNIPNALGIHLEMRKKFTPSVFRQMQHDFELIEDDAKDRGYRSIVASTTNFEDEKWGKFCSLFGFQDHTKMQFAFLPIMQPGGN